MKSEQTTTGSKTYGIGEAQVIAVRSENQHEVRVFHPDFGVTEFIPFIQTPGMYRVPRPGDNCFVFCSENWTDYPMAWGHRLSPELISQLVGKRLDNITVIYSSGANNKSVTHTIELDDGDQSGVRVKTGSGNNINITDKDKIEVTHRTGSFIRVEEGSIRLSVKGSTIVMDSSGISITSAGGATTKLTDSIVSTSSQGSSVSINAGVTSSSSGGSNLEVGSSIVGKAADQASKIDEVIIKTHRHTGNLGIPTTPPLP
jgi:hypothetical protein